MTTAAFLNLHRSLRRGAPLLALLLASTLMAASPNILVHGHRGARAVRPENTLPAFEYAIKAGVDVLELDMAVTKDNVVVVSHDAHLTAPVCTGPKDRAAIRDLNLPAAKDAPDNFVTASVSTSTATPQRESAWEELDLIKAARHALREARASGGNRVLRANLGLTGPPELVGVRR